MRKSFNGLHAAVRDRLDEDPLSGALYLFSNKKRNLMKILYWDGSGLWVMAKRLEKGTFSWAKSSSGETGKVSLTPQALSMLTDGIDLKQGMTRAWYERE